MKYIDRKPFSILKLKLNKSAFIGLFLGLVASFIAIIPVGLVVQQLFKDSLQAGEYISGSTFTIAVDAFMVAFILQDILEEVFFRAYLPQTLETTPIKAMIISTICFGFIHLYTGPRVLPDALFNVLQPTMFGLCAFVLSYIYKSVWAAIGVHAGIHIANTIDAYLNIGRGNIMSFFIGLTSFIIALIFFYIKRNMFKLGNNHLQDI